ncbi:16S rRNA (cytosine(967)-C(5))-methyltransferase RsmB [Limosilactobacillus caecicola]|uniref:16S rRNA (cytosine(967)-C(5))-methyltransferase RsmB n=1 Tax=Limosilactobacillus caecicola TaxID=2941332 RepID=UPI00203BB335|nr:16S rRNA (cytosine(967)-C(5))-methyltransferase RsmB [Limosilactobacillus caecicola]
MNKEIQNSPRYLALSTLDKVLQRGSYSNLQLNETLRHSELQDADKRLVTTLVYGVLQHKLTLEYWLAPLVRKEPQSWVKTLFLMSFYQYRYLDRVPDWAVTDEAIKIAKTRGNIGTRKFVTGVLHTFLRQGPRSIEEVTDPIERLSIQWSLPQWLVGELITQYGQPAVEQIGQAINEPAHMSLRVNLALTTVDEVIQQLAEEGITVRPSEVAAEGLVVEKGKVLSSQAFQKGLVTVQDESAMLAVETLQLASDDQVLDACAAPGGKTGQIAAELTGRGHVTAMDIHAHKVKLIERNVARLHLADRVSAEQLDARQVDQKFADQSFDKILVDAPCSGMGLLRRKPEIRYDKSLKDSQSLHQIQLAILNAMAPKLKKGGIMVYSTCTILQQENEQTVVAFLKAHPEFRLLKTQTKRAIKNGRPEKTLTILPSDFGSDGFFIGTLQRIE